MRYVQSLFVLLLTISLLESCHYKHKAHQDLEEEEEAEGRNKQASLLELDSLYRLQMQDPATGDVPRERLQFASEYIQDLIRANDNNPNRAPINGVLWTERGPNNVAGRTRAILVDVNDATGNTVWAGAAGGGLWRTTNMNSATPTWTLVGSNFAYTAVVSLAQDPSNTQLLYAGTGEGFGNADAQRGLGIWKSADGGTTWNQLANTNNTNFRFVNRIAITSTGVVYAATTVGLYRSIDNGTTWASVRAGNTSDLGLAANGDVWIGVKNTGVYKSTTGNSGSFNLQAAAALPTTNLGRIELATAPSNSQVVYALFEGSGGACQAIAKTTDGGTTWTACAVPTVAPGGGGFAASQAWYDLACEVSPSDANRVYIGGLDLCASSNGGTSWTQISQWYGSGFPFVHADHHFITFQPGSSSVAYFGNDGGIFQSTNANAASPNFTFKGNGYNVTQFYACALHPAALSPVALAGAQDNGSHYFDSPSIDNTVAVTGGDGAFCHIDQDQPNIQITSYIYDLFHITNNTWGSYTDVQFNNASDIGRFISPTDYDNTSNVLYGCHNNGVYGYITGVGTTNTVSSNAIADFGGAKISCITVSPNTANRVFFGLDNGDVVMVDNANTNAPVSRILYSGSNYMTCIAVETGNDNHMLITYSNFGVTNVYESVNATAAVPVFTGVDGNLPDMPVWNAMFSPLNSSQALLATELGVWSTDLINGGATQWSITNTGLINTRVTMFQYRPSDGLVIASTHGRGLWQSDVFTNATALFSATPTLSYVGKDVQFNDASYKAVSWLWDFGDGQTSTLQNPTHAYAAEGLYNVTLTINGGASTLTKNQYIRILPNRPTPYAPADGGNFEVNLNDFAANTTSGTGWERGSSAIAGKSGTFSAGNAWVTGLAAANYVDNSTSSLYCPNFDLSVPAVYTLRFRAKFRTESTWDGFRVEYSLDKGTSWSALGTTTAAGWYNYANTAGSRPFPTNEAYFSGNVSASFNQYTYDLSFLSGQANVAFRMVFKSDESATDAGVAVDEFEILQPTLLPIELLSFNATQLHDRITLDWHTATEQNSRGYHVMRSYDGVNFENLGFVSSHGNGTSNTQQDYTFDDFNLRPGYHYYRLKQEDLDGRFMYSQIKVINIGAGSTPIKAYPSPFEDDLELFINEWLTETITIKIFNANGALVREEQISPSQIYTVVHLRGLSNLPRGAYAVVAYSGSRLLGTTKVIK